MKFIVTVALLWTTTFSRAALFDFDRGATLQVSTQSNAWAVDVATARQFYLAWVASVDRVYRHFIAPGTNLQNGPTNRFTTSALLSQSVFVGIFGLLAAALISAARSVCKVLSMPHRQLAKCGN